MKARLCPLAILLALATSISVSVAALPNIVIILADDMGYGDVAAQNPASKIPTPHLDGLSRAGVTFTDAHTPSAVCTPTRYGLLTGRYCWRTKLKRGVINGYGAPVMTAGRKTVASVLKTKGYTTGAVGKWHLGFGYAKKDSGEGFDFTKPVDLPPNAFGFDFSHVIPASLDFPPYVFIRDGKITQQPTLHQPAVKFPAFLRKGERAPNFVMETCLDDLASEAVAFIEREVKKEAPYFLYFPLTAPHKPVLPHSRFRGKSKLGPYGDFVMQVDSTVGRVLKSVADTGEEENTIVIYTSDNGSFMYHLSDDEKDHVDDESIQGYRASNHRANHIYRGTKADVWESGHRVPFFFRWPAKAKPGKSDKTICITDILATCADVAGVTPDANTGEDSFSFLSAALSSGAEAQARPPVVHHSGGGMFAIREGKWKLVLGNGSGGRQQPRGKPFEKPWHLYDLEADPGESNNLIESKTEVAAKLESEFEKIRAGGYKKAWQAN